MDNISVRDVEEREMIVVGGEGIGLGGDDGKRGGGGEVVGRMGDMVVVSKPVLQFRASFKYHTTTERRLVGGNRIARRTQKYPAGLRRLRVGLLVN